MTTHDTNERDFKVKNITEQVEAFQILLCAMYKNKLAVNSTAQLGLLAKQAKHYGCIPMLSRALNGASPWGYEGLMKSIKEDCLVLVEFASKLRLTKLFKDCMIHLTGPFEAPIYYDLRNKQLKQLAENAHRTVQAKNEEFMQYFKAPRLPDQSKGIKGWAYETFGYSLRTCAVSHPRLYYTLDAVAEARGTKENEFRDKLRPVMSKNLAYHQKGQAGLSDYEDYFLCAEIGNTNLPWNPDEIEW